MKTLMTTLAAGALMMTPALAQGTPAKSADAAQAVYSISTEDFARMAMSSDMFEIRSSEMAQEKAEAEAVKSFAADMIKDHEKAEADMKAAAEKGNAQLPASAELAPKHAAMLQQLEAADGADFQTLYVDMQAQSHMEAVALFRTYAGSGDNEAIVAFAKATLPTLEGHMMHVKELVAAE